MQFLNPINDYAFKKIFGNENKKHILISFLNSILRLSGNKQILEVTLLNPHQAPYLPGTKESILDVRCRDQSGASYIVEMQVLHRAFFDRRVLYYASKAYAQQLDNGEDYCLLKPVIFLGILDFKFTEDTHYLSTHCIQNIETRERILHDFQFTFAELPKFNKTEDELITVEDKWLYFLKCANKLNAIPDIIQETAVRDAFEILNRLTWSKEEFDYYDYRGIKIQDEIQYMNYPQGVIDGEKKGEKRGEIAVLTRLLSKRFGPLSDFYQVQLAQASSEQLILWEDRVLDAKTLDEIFNPQKEKLEV